MHRHPLTPEQETPRAIVYKILPRSDWEAAVETGLFKGSDDDQRDGFIHLSSGEQLAGTAAKYFRGQANLLLVSFQAEELGDKLVWEASRGGALFPHLYADLPADKALSVFPLGLDDDGVPMIPGGLE